jgi:hypothetical protein
VLVRREAVPDFPVEAEVVQRVDMRTRVRVHRQRRAGVADMLVLLAADTDRVIDRGAARCVR